MIKRINHQNQTGNWVEIKDESRGTYKASNQIEFKTLMTSSNLCDYSDAYILVSGTITITREGADDDAKRLDERYKGVIFKNYAPFIEYISNVNNTQIDSAKDIDVVMPMYNLIEYRDNYSKTLGSLQQCYRDDPNDNITQSESFKSKIKRSGKAPADGKTKTVEIVVPLIQ